MGFWSNVGKRRMKRIWLPCITVKSHQYQDEIIPNPLSYKPHIFVYVRTFPFKKRILPKKENPQPSLAAHEFCSRHFRKAIDIGILHLGSISSIEFLPNVFTHLPLSTLSLKYLPKWNSISA